MSSPGSALDIEEVTGKYIPFVLIVNLDYFCWKGSGKMSFVCCLVRLSGQRDTAYFSIRGYPTELVTKAFLETNKLPRNEILVEKSDSVTEPDKKLFLILDFNPSLSPIKEWLLELWPILYKSSGTRKLVDVKPIIGYRRPKNLQDILVTSDLPEIKWLHGRNRISIPRCNRSACRHCPVLDRTGWIKSHSTGRKYRTQTRISCMSSNLI